MEFDLWLAFAAASVALLIIPGPTILLVLSCALGQGRSVAFATVAGVALGHFAAMSASLFGLGALIPASTALSGALKWGGAFILICLGAKLLRTTALTGAGVPPAPHALPARGIFGRVLIVTALNPQSVAFFILFVPQFTRTDSALAPQEAHDLPPGNCQCLGQGVNLFAISPGAVFGISPVSGPTMPNPFDRELEDRLVRYAAIDSQSDAASETAPSTARQLDILRLLETELKEIGAQDVTLTDYGVVLATIPGTVPGPTIGLLAHVDTAPQFNATGVKPRVIRGYNGDDITFPDDPELVLSPAEFPYLASKAGDDIITASGTTLLGADDKAGVAIIMTAARHMLTNPDLPHGPVRIAFTPDEEIGRGVTPALARDIQADFAYTFDGGDIGEIVHESFSADGAEIVIKGVSIHPGQAKEKMVNAIHLAARIIATLPQATLTPETTDGREGFIHATDMEGGSSEMRLRLIIRDFERDGLAAKGALVQQVCAAVQATEPRSEISCTITPQYRNMRYWLEDDMTPVELVQEAAQSLGIEHFSTPIRGGTDGSLLTEMGVPTPNIFTGMQNIHGPLEWISVQDMAKATELCLAVLARAARPQD